ncbi:MAG: CvpA family protein [Oceanococcus sp.]
MLWIDYIIIGVIAISAVISLFRGFVKEVFSLMSWALAFWVSMRYGAEVAERFFTMVSTPSARSLLGYLAVFLVVLIAGALFSHFMTLLVKQTQLQGTDRALGLIFGGARGVLLVTVVVMLAKMTPLDEDPWWKEATLVSYFENLGAWVQQQLPPEAAEKLRSVQDSAIPVIVPGNQS